MFIIKKRRQAPDFFSVDLKQKCLKRFWYTTVTRCQIKRLTKRCGGWGGGGGGGRGRGGGGGGGGGEGGVR